jgi:hypothetical protein
LKTIQRGGRASRSLICYACVLARRKLMTQKIMTYGAYAAPYDEVICLHERTDFLTEKQHLLLKKNAHKFETSDTVEISHGQMINIIRKFEKLTAAEKA